MSGRQVDISDKIWKIPTHCCYCAYQCGMKVHVLPPEPAQQQQHAGPAEAGPATKPAGAGTEAVAEGAHRS